ncbi:MAG: hypothetical protein GF417_03450 [Candidatus Latescibacteria bacterium]|nr:hypothetical protein [bacterium]MBD3423484.1 hypothetical protein [Candidatus Latescibacterota bacterium]
MKIIFRSPEVKEGSFSAEDEEGICGEGPEEVIWSLIFALIELIAYLQCVFFYLSPAGPVRAGTGGINLIRGVDDGLQEKDAGSSK